MHACMHAYIVVCISHEPKTRSRTGSKLQGTREEGRTYPALGLEGFRRFGAWGLGLRKNLNLSSQSKNITPHTIPK